VFIPFHISNKTILFAFSFANHKLEK